LKAFTERSDRDVLTRSGTLPVLIALLLVNACGQREQPVRPLSGDDVLRQALIGTWSCSNRGEVRLARNGSLWAGWTNYFNSPPHAWTFQGQWAVSNGVFIASNETVQSWNTTDRVQTTTEQHQIVDVNQKTLVLVADPDHTNWFIRIK
jgi:hypothetical protein